MAVSTDPRIGSEFLGYRIEALLGRGGMSVVYRAEHSRLRRKVALKLLAPELGEDAHFRERFLRESQLAASLDHPHIVPVYDAGEVAGQLYIAMRYVAGGDLRTVLRAERGLEPRRALALLAQVADALDAAHEAGLVHRDVKPANVLIDAREHCYLADFGLTKEVASQSGLTTTGQVVGTTDYLAPEVIEGAQFAASADLYALGCLLYESLTGSVPFRHDSQFAVLWAHVNVPPPGLSGRRPDIPKELDAVVKKALAKSPSRRYGSGRELVEAARSALPEPAPILSRPRRRRLLLVVAAAVTAAAVAAALSLVFTGRTSGPSTTPTLAITRDSLQRIDPRTSRLVATIRLGPHGTGGLAASRDALWVTPAPRIVLRIDPESGRARTIFRLGGEGEKPLELAFDGTRTLWVNDLAGVIGIDTSRAAVDPHSMKFEWWSSGVTTAGSESVWVDQATPAGNVTRLDPLGDSTNVAAGAGTPIAMTVGFGSAWVAEYGPGPDSLVRVSDGAIVRVLAIVPLQFTPSPSGAATGFGAVWLSDPEDDEVVRIEPGSNRITQRIRVGRYPTGVAVGAGAVWVANHEDGTVSRIDPRTGRVVRTIAVGPKPTEVAVGAGGVWVAVHPT